MKPKRIWFALDPVEHLRQHTPPPCLIQHLGIELVEAGDDYLVGRMPVDSRTHQPYGLLHGGASVVLAETLASIGAARVIDAERSSCVGLEINANHLRGVREGWVYGRATPVHLGRSTHVWSIDIRDEQDRAVCVSRCTMSILTR